MIFGFGRSDLEQISAAEAISLSGGDSWLVDVREPFEWNEGHAPNAVSLPMSQLNERMTELPFDTTLLIICQSGQRSQSVTARLERAGYSAVNVIGGMDEWVSAGGVVARSDHGDRDV